MKASNLKFYAAAALFLLLSSLFLSSCGLMEKKKMREDFAQFLGQYESKVVSLSAAANLAYFKATISGKDEDYQKSADLSIQLSKVYADTTDFARLKKIKESGAITDSLNKRQLDLIYNAYAENQIDEAKLEAMINLQTGIEQKFSTYRAMVDGKSLTDNQVEDILKNSKDSNQLKRTWIASKKIGEVVAPDVIRLVKMRNEAAHELGFANFHAMRLKLNEQDPEEIESLFDELDSLTRDAFAAEKADVDRFLAKRDGIKESELMPWHYQNRYFQEAPKIYDVDMDKYYKNQDLVQLVTSYYESIGLPIPDLVKNSDLYEKPGKYQHAYCTDIDKEGDVRVVANVKPNYNWMNTLLHEFGHAVYDKYSDRTLPWTLREPAHTFTTEAIAMMFGRFAGSPAWLRDVVGISPQEAEKISAACRQSQRLEQLTFSRWAQVMYRFEKSMYENPDQDLNKLWWDLVEKYQLLKRPEGRNAPDWASKIHVATVPAYYHNYLMGELLASQFYTYIVTHVLNSQDLWDQSFSGKKAVGTYLIDNVFAPGKRYYWNDMIERATGEKLTARYFARQFVEK